MKYIMNEEEKRVYDKGNELEEWQLRIQEYVNEVIASESDKDDGKCDCLQHNYQSQCPIRWLPIKNNTCIAGYDIEQANK